MNTSTIRAALFLSATVLLGACSGQANYIDTEDGICSLDVDILDIEMAVDGLVESMLEEEVLRTSPHGPAQLEVDYFINDTSSHFSTDEFVSRLREQLVNSGHATFLEVTDGARRIAWEGEPVAQPDFVLRGKTTYLKSFVKDEDVYQATYTFCLDLLEYEGEVVWTGTVSMTKQQEN